MVPTFLFDISGIDLQKIQVGPEDIEKINPHRGAMRLLDGICWMSPGMEEAVAFKDVRHDEFWVPGHVPGRPLLPGVLMIEAGAQLASYLFLRRATWAKFMGFTGVDDVSFRGMVVPGDRLYLIGQEVEFRQRRCICNVQGIVNGNMVFAAKITGMPM